MNKIIKAKDLAQILGISPSTVSMVLNNRPGISEATRKLVFDKMNELSSTPSVYTGRPLANDFIYFVIFKKHGKVVGDTPFFSQLIEGIEHSAKSCGFNLQIAYFNEGCDASLSLPLVHTKECRGILLLATEMNVSDAAVFTSLGCPVVLLDNNFYDIALDCVVINNRQAAGCAVRYLISSGHSQIGYLHSAIHINNFSERKEGYHRELKRNKLEILPQHEYKLTPTIDGAYNDMKEILSTHPELPTAFFADNDIIALSCIRAFREQGIRVPDDISVVGIDDIPMCELMEPPLTTMHVPKHQMGVLAVKRLMEKLEGSSREILTTEIRTSLMRRGSVKSILS